MIDGWAHAAAGCEHTLGLALLAADIVCTANELWHISQTMRHDALDQSMLICDQSMTTFHPMQWQ
jgi:hypothetical protein